MRNGLNQFECEVLADTGLSIPRFAHIRNRVYCSDCKQWFRANKYLGKELVREDKDADAWGVRIHPGIMCGRCGAKCRVEYKAEIEVLPGVIESFPFAEPVLPDYRKTSKRRLKIMDQRRMARENEEDIE